MPAVPPVQDIKTADWSEAVKPFWGAVIRSALSAAGVSGLLRAGWTTIKVIKGGVDHHQGHPGALTPMHDGCSQVALPGGGIGRPVQGVEAPGVLPPQGALVMPLMARGLQKGVIKFACITATKPE